MQTRARFSPIPLFIAVGLLQVANLLAQFGPINDADARSHNYDVRHIALRVSFDIPKGEVFGTVTHTIVPLRSNTDTVAFDAAEMNIESVGVARIENGLLIGNALLTRYDTADGRLNIYFARSFSPRDTLAITIKYSCMPRKGLYFISPDSASPSTPRQIWSQGEGEDNHYWFPCYDYPNDKATSEIYATVPNDYSVLSNGALSDTVHNGDGTATWHWSESHPHSSYLITLAAGKFDVVLDHWRGKPVEYWAWKGRANDLDSCFKYTPDMMEFYSDAIGFPFAWEKYAQVIVAQFMYGGMENTSATTLVDMALHGKRAQIDYNAMGLIAHELAHQWWGDVVTCRDWRDIWLNEGFATYFQMLYFEHLYGEARFRYDLWQTQRGAIAAEKELGKKPIVTAGGLTANTYGKAAAVLNMIRHVLGDSDFYRSLNRYINAHTFGNAETEDLKIAIEDATGQNLQALFDEWLYKAGHPVYDVSYTWNAAKDTLFLTVAQTQKKDSLTGYFDMPIDIEIHAPRQTIFRTIHDDDSLQTFAIACREKPDYIIFDKGSNIPKELHFHRPLGDVLAQLKRGTPVERGYAIEDLRDFDSLEIVRHTLENTALRDTFAPVREEALGVLGGIKDSAVAPTLIQLTRSGDAGIRSAAAGALGSHPSEPAYNAVLRVLNTDMSYAAKRSAMFALARMDSVMKKNTFEVITPYVDSASFRDWLREAAFGAMKTLNDQRALPLAMRFIREGGVRDARAAAIAVVEKFGKGDRQAADLLLQCLSDKSHGVRFAAAKAIGVIGSQTDVPQLNAALEKENYSWIKDVLRESINKIEGQKHAEKE